MIFWKRSQFVVRNGILALLFIFTCSVAGWAIQPPAAVLRVPMAEMEAAAGVDWTKMSGELKAAGFDGFMIVMNTIHARSRDVLETLLDVWDESLPPGSVFLGLNLQESKEYRLEDGPALLEQIDRHPSMARFKGRPCLFLTGEAHKETVDSFLMEIRGKGLADQVHLFSDAKVDSFAREVVVPFMNVSTMTTEEMEEMAGSLRLLRRPVAVVAGETVSSWKRLKELGAGVSCDLIVAGPVPKLIHDGIFPDELIAAVSAVKEGYREPTIDLKGVIKEVRGQLSLVLQATNLTSKETLQGTISALADEPFRLHPQQALIEVQQTEEVVMALIGPERPSAGNARIRATMEAEGYRTTMGLIHKVPLISPMMMILPTVDGDLSDWGKADRTSLLDEDGKERGILMAGWIRRWFYLGFHIKDVDLRQDGVGMEVAEQDHIRVGIDPFWDQQAVGYNSDDLEFVMALTKKGPVIVPSDAVANTVLFDGVKFAVSRSGEDLIYELALSPSSRSVWKMEPRSIIGVAVRIHATDRTTGKPLVLRWGDGLTGARSPLLFGAVGLGDAR